MNNAFGFSQGTDGIVQFAHMKVPGCGRQQKDDAPVISVEIEGENITLLVYSDIKSNVPTHEIPLNGAKLEKKKVTANG